jgi:hypothetical protein
VTSVRRFDWFLLFPLLGPAVLLAAGNDGFGFDPPGWVDSSVYLGYFWHYSQHLWLFDDNLNYKISRLPWVLPGFAVHSLLPPVAAGLVLAYGTLTSAAVALYLQVRDALSDRYVAAFVSLMLAFGTGMHAPGGWYYHALPAAGYYLWACWLLRRAATAHRHGAGWSAAAGASFTAAVHTHLFLAVFAPLLVVLYWGALDVGQNRWSRWRTTIVSAIAGGVVLTVILGTINRTTGGVWLFFLPQVEIALKLSRSDPWWLPTAQWLPSATYLVVPMALIATALGSGYRFWKKEERRTGTLVLVSVVALAITCFFQFWTRETTLDYDYMAFVLYLHALPATAVALWYPAGREPQRRRLTLLIAATSIVVLPLLTLMPSPLPAFMNSNVIRVGLGQAPEIVPPLLFSLLGVVVARLAPPALRVAVVAMWFSVVNAWIAPQPVAYGIGTPGVRQEMLETFRDADEFAQQLDPSLIGIKYWISSESLTTPVGPVQSQQVFDSFLATRAWLTNLFARKSPGLPIEQLTLAHLERASCIGILSFGEQQVSLSDAMMAHYASLGRPLGVLAERRFERKEFRFALTVLRPIDRPGVSPGNLPPCMTTDPRIDERGRQKRAPGDS